MWTRLEATPCYSSEYSGGVKYAGEFKMDLALCVAAAAAAVRSLGLVTNLSIDNLASDLI